MTFKSKGTELNFCDSMLSNKSTDCQSLWSPYEIGQTIISSSCGFFFFFFFSSPNLSCRRLDVCHTSTHGVALV